MFITNSTIEYYTYTSLNAFNCFVFSDYILLNNNEVNLEIASTCNLNYEDKSFKIHALEELNVCDDDFIHTQKSHRTYMDLSNINETQRQVHEETSEG